MNKNLFMVASQITKYIGVKVILLDSSIKGF